MNNTEKIIEHFKDSFMYILSIIELIVSISLSINGKKILAIIIGIAFIVSIAYAITMSIIKNKNGKKTNKKDPLVIDGKPLDLLMLANAFRTEMDSVEVSKVIHKAIIKENNDLTVVWNYSGKCIKKEGESYFVFNIQGGNDTPLEKLNCYGFDLINDPEKKQPIYATLLPSEQGISSDYKVKKIIVPFLKKLDQNSLFSIELHYTWPNSMVYNEDYYISSLSFKNDKLSEYQVILEFERIAPKWIRAYDSDGNLLKQVSRTYSKGKYHVYIDNVIEPSVHSTLIYKFYREEPKRNN